MEYEKIRRAVICAGGKGTRLLPLTKAINKHLLPIGKEPMILHVVKNLVASGIEDIAIVTTSEGMTPIASFLGSGKEYYCNITYFCQDLALGIPDAILCAEDFIGDEPFSVVLGDNIFTENLRSSFDRFLRSDSDGMIFLSEVDNPSQFGIAIFRDGNLVEIKEKPKNPESNLCVTGIYAYRSSVFQMMKDLKPSQRKELEISDLNSQLVSQGKMISVKMSGLWLDAGTLDDYAKAFCEVLDAN
jgi:glucose-1-phosphate thymidylyltransferase